LNTCHRRLELEVKTLKTFKIAGSNTQFATMAWTLQSTIAFSDHPTPKLGGAQPELAASYRAKFVLCALKETFNKSAAGPFPYQVGLLCVI